MLRELVERCIAKDESAWKEFIRNFENVVRLSIRLKLSHLNYSFCEEDIRDISQNVFSDIWEKDKLLSVREKDKIKSWLCIVAQNTAVDFIRRDNLLGKRINPAVNSDSREFDVLDVTPSGVASPSQIAEKSELHTIVDEFLQSLPSQKRLILTLYLLHEKTHKEIAHIVNISINSVSTTIRRQKEKLKRHLQDKGYRGY